MATGKGLARRTVEPDAVLSAEEFEALRKRIAAAVSTFRSDLLGIEQALLGKTATAPAKMESPRISLFRNAYTGVGAIPSVSEKDSTELILSVIAKYGLRETSYSKMVPVTAPNEIDDVGNYYDAKEVYDAWILNPSIDTKFDFDKPPSQNTPFVSANSRAQFQLRAQKVFYLAENPGTVGTLQIWLFKY